VQVSGGGEEVRWLAAWRELWPLFALAVLAAVLRFATLDLQSLWFDEAFTPTHVLHRSLSATLSAVSHTESTPPLYYVLAWGWSRVLGTGVIALRSLSALAGLAMVPVAWALGRTLAGRRTAIVLAALVTVNPLFVWYSQEARSYILFALLASLSLLFFLRARAGEGSRALWAWAVFSSLALLTHYFAAVLVAVEAALLVAPSGGRLREGRAAWLPTALVGVVGLALIPLVAAQGGHGTQWIGHWALSSRLLAIPRYYLAGPSAEPLGNGLLLVAALPVLAALLLAPRLAPREAHGAKLTAAVGAACIAIPLALVLVGADYLAPRNLIGASVPLTAALAVLLSAERVGRAGALLALVMCGFGLAFVIDVDASPRLQRGDWQGVAHALSGGPPQRAIVSPGLGTAPLEYYLPPLRRLRPGATTTAQELDLVGYAPLVPGAARPPARGFQLVLRRSVHGLLVLRFRAAHAVSFPERWLRAKRLVQTRTEVLVPG
jgi:uncharacterized membrane protein